MIGIIEDEEPTEVPSDTQYASKTYSKQTAYSHVFHHFREEERLYTQVGRPESVSCYPSYPCPKFKSKKVGRRAADLEVISQIRTLQPRVRDVVDAREPGGGLGVLDHRVERVLSPGLVLYITRHAPSVECGL